MNSRVVRCRSTRAATILHKPLTQANHQAQAQAPAQARAHSHHQLTWQVRVLHAGTLQICVGERCRRSITAPLVARSGAEAPHVSRLVRVLRAPRLIQHYCPARPRCTAQLRQQLELQYGRGLCGGFRTNTESLDPEVPAPHATSNLTVDCFVSAHRAGGCPSHVGSPLKAWRRTRRRPMVQCSMVCVPPRRIPAIACLCGSTCTRLAGSRLLRAPAATAVATFGKPFAQWSGEEVRRFLVADPMVAESDRLSSCTGRHWHKCVERAMRRGGDVDDAIMDLVRELYNCSDGRAIFIADRLLAAYNYGECASRRPHTAHVTHTQPMSPTHSPCVRPPAAH